MMKCDTCRFKLDCDDADGKCLFDVYQLGQQAQRAKDEVEYEAQINLLATALREVLIKAEVLNTEVEPSGPELLLAAQDYIEHCPSPTARIHKREQEIVEWLWKEHTEKPHRWYQWVAERLSEWLKA